MFFRLRWAHTYFSHSYVQHEMTFLLQLGRCNLLLKVWQLLAPQIYIFDGHPHDTSFRSILEDDFISFISRTHICFCSGKGARLWLFATPSIHLFYIAHSIFTSSLCFCLGQIQPSTSSFFTCECGHKLYTSCMHLACCPFEGQQITTHDAIQNVMYAFI